MIDTKAIRAAAEEDANAATGCGKDWAYSTTVIALLDRLEAAEKDAARYRWLAEHPNEWRIYRKHGKHLRPFKMMRDGEPWGQSFSTADQAIDAAMKEQK